MDSDYLRQRVRNFLMKEAQIRSGGDLNYNPPMLLGDGKRVGRPRKVGRPKIVKHRAVKKVGGSKQSDALADWRLFFEKYRRKHPNMPYREAQKKAAVEYKK